MLKERAVKLLKGSEWWLLRLASLPEIVKLGQLLDGPNLAS
ncbi:hypothetical protein [Shimia sp. NS0008-38b]